LQIEKIKKTYRLLVNVQIAVLMLMRMAKQLSNVNTHPVFVKSVVIDHAMNPANNR
jgi:hypothetical protein